MSSEIPVGYKPGTFCIVPNKHRFKTLSKHAVLAWVALCMFSDSDGNCWPSIKTLSEGVGVSKNTMRRGIEELQTKKWVKKKIRKEHDKQHNSNYYTLYYLAEK